MPAGHVVRRLILNADDRSCVRDGCAHSPAVARHAGHNAICGKRRRWPADRTVSGFDQRGSQRLSQTHRPQTCRGLSAPLSRRDWTAVRIPTGVSPGPGALARNWTLTRASEPTGFGPIRFHHGMPWRFRWTLARLIPRLTVFGVMAPIVSSQASNGPRTQVWPPLRF
jgi:hypothetical protein